MFPWDDWQFYVVSLAALTGLFYLVRPFLPARKKPGGCASCPGASPPTRRGDKP